jgi:hypothetical protein
MSTLPPPIDVAANALLGFGRDDVETVAVYQDVPVLKVSSAQIVDNGFKEDEEGEYPPKTIRRPSSSRIEAWPVMSAGAPPAVSSSNLGIVWSNK